MAWISYGSMKHPIVDFEVLWSSIVRGSCAHSPVGEAKSNNIVDKRLLEYLSIELAHTVVLTLEPILRHH